MTRTTGTSRTPPVPMAAARACPMMSRLSSRTSWIAVLLRPILPSAHEIYKEANQLYYDLAVGVPLDVATSHAYRQRWVQGEILNPIFPGLYYYAMYKD